MINPETKIISLVKKIRKRFDTHLTKEELAQKICENYKVKIKEEYLSIASDGQYISESNCIILNKNCTYKPRAIFTLFHEILHFLIEKEGEDIIELLTEHSRDTYQDSIETLCDLGASEFLLPEDEIREIIKDKEIDLSLFRDLLKTYEDVSAPAIARKLAYLADYSAIFIICGEKIFSIPSGDLLELEVKISQNLAIEYWFSTHTFKYRLKRFHPIPQNHIIEQAFRGEIDSQGEDFFPFSNNKTKWKCSVDCFTHNNRVYGILYEKKRIKNKNQLSFF